jgi:hypothetical protein
MLITSSFWPLTQRYYEKLMDKTLKRIRSHQLIKNHFVQKK